MRTNADSTTQEQETVEGDFGGSYRVQRSPAVLLKAGGRYLKKKWSGYHRRSLLGTKMHCFKRLGERVMARTLK